MTTGPAPMIRIEEMSVRLGMDLRKLAVYPLPFAGEGRRAAPGGGGEMARHHFLTSRSRALRQNSTDGERKLWSVLRSRQLSGFKFRKQVEIDGYVVDFLCPERRLIIEVDGGQHTPERDARRTAYLEGQGFRLVR